MLFNSYAFIFGFCPILFGVFFLMGRFSRKAALAWLFLGSLAFYSWWNPRDLTIILGSMSVNFAFGYSLLRHRSTSTLALGIALNLGLLCYYKYAHFFFGVAPQTLPLGISFFTFVQIAFLVDAWRKEKILCKPLEYGLFVTYFPHLIAGPIIHHTDVMPYFQKESFFKPRAENFSVGMSLFAIGLFKKTVFADHVSGFVAPVFDSAGSFTVFEYWGAALAYTLQIYFDFSGYSDMALGLSKVLGIPLPANFFSPYKSRNIIEFWRRWHMSLSRFLRDYLYIPLGGNRKGPTRRYVNLLATMVLGGLWHGAGWTFIIWGALHGFYLIVNHAWQSFFRKRTSVFSTALSTGLTFLAVVVAWVFFRAPDLNSALRVLWGMFDFSSMGAFISERKSLFPTVVSLRGTGLLWLAGLLAIAFFAPNSLELTERFSPATGTDKLESTKFFSAHWKPNTAWAAIVSLLFIAGVIEMNKQSVFLYFQF